MIFISKLLNGTGYVECEANNVHVAIGILADNGYFSNTGVVTEKKETPPGERIVLFPKESVFEELNKILRKES